MSDHKFWQLFGSLLSTVESRPKIYSRASNSIALPSGALSLERANTPNDSANIQIFEVGGITNVIRTLPLVTINACKVNINKDGGHVATSSHCIKIKPKYPG